MTTLETADLWEVSSPNQKLQKVLLLLFIKIYAEFFQQEIM